MQLKGIFVSLNHIKPAGKAASNKKEDSNMAFFNSAITVLQTLVVALGAGLGIWGAINLHYVETTKMNAGTRKIPMTEEVFRCFQAILEDREAPKYEKMIDGYTGFLYLDANGMPEVAMHWENRFKHAVTRYNDIYRVQMPTITPHVCRHTYCSNQAKAGMNPKTLQYLMGHSDIGVTLNTYTHLGLEDAAAEMARMEAVEAARREQEKLSGEPGQLVLSQKMFKTV